MDAQIREAMVVGASIDSLTPRTVHAYLVARLTDECGGQVSLELKEDGTELVFIGSADTQ